MSNGDMNLRDARDPTVNPAVKITILFEEGNGLIWKLEKPWAQADLFMEIGLLGAKYEVGIDFEFPVGDEGSEAAVAIANILVEMQDFAPSEGEMSTAKEFMRLGVIELLSQYFKSSLVGFNGEEFLAKSHWYPTIMGMRVSQAEFELAEKEGGE